jgi:hypothetical protein
MVARWNESLPGDEGWPEPATAQQELTVFAEWMRRSLEFPIRVLWEAGSGTVTDEEVTGAVNSCLLPWLVAFSGLEGELALPAWYEAGAEPGLQDVGGTALSLLTRLQKDAPEGLLSFLAEQAPTATLDTLRGQATLDAAVFALRDGKGPRKECLRRLLQEVRRVMSNPAPDPAHEGSLLWALSNSLWRHQHLVFTVADEHRWFLPWFIEATEARFRALHSSLTVTAVDDVSAASWLFGLSAEILLGVLRLRQDGYYARILGAGNARMMRVARLVRRIDALLAERGVTVTSSLRLTGEKPEGLFRMSELAFVLNAFLTGDSGANLVQIAASEEDEEDAGG